MKVKLLIIALLMPILAFAQNIDEKEARKIAASVLKKNTVNLVRRAPDVYDKGHNNIVDPHIKLHRVVNSIKGDKPCFYVYNQEGGNGGFVIVSNQGQILAHSDQGTIDYDNIPDNVKWLLGQYQKILSTNISSLDPNSNSTNKQYGCPWFYRNSIEPLVGSEWEQGAPFNDMIRKKYEASGAAYEQEIFAGCVTIAMAQTMFKWKHPRNGSGSTNWKVGNTTYCVNYADPIDWDHIGPRGWTPPSTTEALADLCYRVAASLDSKVKDNETIAYANDIPKALTTYFDYDASIRDESSVYYSGDVYEDIAYNELEQGRPCIIYGEDESLFGEGHTMVIEGYNAEDNTFFINMGWGEGGQNEGYPYNSYYALTVKNGIHYTYVHYQHIITHIYPNQGKQPTAQIRAERCNLMRSTILTKARGVSDNDKNDGNQTYHVSARIYNSSNDMDANIVTGVMAKDYTTGKECLFEGPKLELTKWYSQDVDFDIDLSKIEYNGYYQLRPVFRMIDDDEWFTIGIYLQNQQLQPVCVDVSNAKMLDLGQEVDFTMAQTTLEIGMPVEIKYNTPIMGVPMTFSSSDPSTVSVDENGKVVARKEGEAIITAHCDDYMFNGNRLVKETTKQFLITGKESLVDHKVELIYFFPNDLETNDDIVIKNHIGIVPTFYNPDFSMEIVYTLGFFQNNELVEKGYFTTSEYIMYNRYCEYEIHETLLLHKDLNDGEYELRLLYRIPGETPEDEYWIMPTQRKGESKVFMKLENGHATFRQINKHPCELQVNANHLRNSAEVGMSNYFTVDMSRTSELAYNEDSDIFFYIDGKYVGHNEVNFKEEPSVSFIVRDFMGEYIFTPDHVGTYNFKIFDGKHQLLYEENIVVDEAKKYQLRVNKVRYRNSTVPNTANDGIKLELEIENIGENRYRGDIICQPTIDNDESEFWAPRADLDIAPGEIVKKVLPLDFEFYFYFYDYITIKCYYISEGEKVVLWESEKLKYIDPSTNILHGDANNDNKVNAVDIVYIVSKLRGRLLPNFNENAADADVSGEISEDDITEIRDIILYNQ